MSCFFLVLEAGFPCSMRNIRARDLRLAHSREKGSGFLCEGWGSKAFQAHDLMLLVSEARV